jgi:hypothetical protein
MPGAYTFIITRYWSKIIDSNSDYSVTSATLRVVVK